MFTLGEKTKQIISGYINLKKMKSIILEDYIRLDEYDDWRNKYFLIKVPIFGFEREYLGLDLMKIIHQDTVELGIKQSFLDISEWDIEIIDRYDMKNIDIELEVIEKTSVDNIDTF